MSALGMMLQRNMQMGLPTRTKSAGDYVGYPMSPCGDFAKSSSSTSSSTKTPWLPSSSAASSLHDEISQFLQYMEPTAREKQIRVDLIQRFQNLISSFKMDVIVRSVGSYVTGLYLPNSDIDMVLTFGSSMSNGRYDLIHILYKIQASGFASKVVDVLHATVPLIRITDRRTGIEIDLTCSDNHAIKATKAVQKWMKTDTDVIKMLITVVKMFLSIRKCGTTYTGGVNSYVLVWMVVAWIHLEWKKPRNGTAVRTRSPSSDMDSISMLFETLTIQNSRSIASSTTARNTLTSTSTSKESARSTPVDFGEVLAEFLAFYGNTFDYRTQAIAIEPWPSYKTKTHPSSLYSYRFTQDYLLSIFDPANTNIDMGSKAYGIKHVQASFKQAHGLLVRRKETTRAAGSQRLSILGELLGGDFTIFEQKRKLLDGK